MRFAVVGPSSRRSPRRFLFRAGRATVADTISTATSAACAPSAACPATPRRATARAAPPKSCTTCARPMRRSGVRSTICSATARRDGEIIAANTPCNPTLIGCGREKRRDRNDSPKTRGSLRRTSRPPALPMSRRPNSGGGRRATHCHARLEPGRIRRRGGGRCLAGGVLLG